MSDLNGVIGRGRCRAGKGAGISGSPTAGPCLIGQPCVHIFLWRRNTNYFTMFVGTERRREPQNLTLMSVNHTLAFNPHSGFLGFEYSPPYQEPFDTCQVRTILRYIRYDDWSLLSIIRDQVLHTHALLYPQNLLMRQDEEHKRKLSI